MTEQTKACIYCKHFTHTNSEYFRSGMCKRFKKKADQITGNLVGGERYAFDERSLSVVMAFLYRECGKSGRYFEPKE